MEEITLNSAPVRRRLDERHQYLLTMLIGGLIVSVVQFILSIPIAGSLGYEGVMNNNCITTISGWAFMALFYGGIILRMIGYSGSKKRARIFDIVSSVFAVTVTLIAAVCMFFLAGPIIRMLFGGSADQVSLTCIRVFALCMVLSLAISALMGVFIKKRLLIAGIILGGVFLLTVAAIAAYAILMHFVSVPLWTVGVIPGLLYPVVYAFPNIGAWKAKRG